MNERIETALAVVKAAEATLEAVLSAEQAKCQHLHIAEAPWEKLGPYSDSGSLSPLRLCLDCGLEEEGSHWSGRHQWSAVDFTPAQLGNQPGRTISVIENRDAFYALRID